MTVLKAWDQIHAMTPTSDYSELFWFPQLPSLRLSDSGKPCTIFAKAEEIFEKYKGFIKYTFWERDTERFWSAPECYPVGTTRFMHDLLELTGHQSLWWSEHILWADALVDPFNIAAKPVESYAEFYDYFQPDILEAQGGEERLNRDASRLMVVQILFDTYLTAFLDPACLNTIECPFESDRTVVDYWIMASPWILGNDLQEDLLLSPSISSGWMNGTTVKTLFEAFREILFWFCVTRYQVLLEEINW